METKLLCVVQVLKVMLKGSACPCSDLGDFYLISSGFLVPTLNFVLL